MKKYFIFAASALALASCSSDDFLERIQETYRMQLLLSTLVVRQERLHVLHRTREMTM